MTDSQARPASGSGTLVGVLALQGDVREHRRILEGLGARTTAVRTVEDLHRVDGLVVPGGESTTMWRLARSFRLLEPLRKRVQAGMPAYGSCAGMIMLADHVEDGVDGQETIGGIDMIVRRNAFGRQVDSFEAELDFPAIGTPPLRAVFIRAPWVERVGAEVDVLARTTSEAPVGALAASPEASGSAGRLSASPEASGSAGRLSASPEASGSAGRLSASPEASGSAGRIVAVRAGGLLATSFHPELTTDTRVHALFLDMVKEA